MYVHPWIISKDPTRSDRPTMKHLRTDLAPHVASYLFRVQIPRWMQELLALLDSPLNKAGKLQVIHIAPLPSRDTKLTVVIGIGLNEEMPSCLMQHP